VGEVDLALPAEWRGPFWDTVASFEVDRRIGLFDYLEYLGERRETRWDPPFEASLVRLAEHRAATSPGYREELEARELLAGLEALGARAAFAAKTMLEAAFDARTGVREAALAAIAASKPAPADALRWTRPRLEAAEWEPREQGFELHEAMSGVVWASFPRRRSRFDKRMLAVVVELLAGAPDAEVEALIEHARTRKLHSFESLVVERLRGEERWGSAIVDALWSPNAYERKRATEALRWLSPPRPDAVSRLVDLLSPKPRDLHPVAAALRALAPDAAAAIPPLELLFATAEDGVKPLLAMTLLTIHAAQSPADIDRMRSFGAWLRGAATDGAPAGMNAARRAIDELPDAVRAELVGLPAEPRPSLGDSLSPCEQLVRDLDPANDDDIEPLMDRLRDRNQSPLDREPMIEALASWHRAPGSRAGQLLAEIFADEREDGRARICAASVLGRHPLAGVLVPMVRPAVRDARAMVRAWALLLLAGSAESTAIADARADESPVVRCVAAHLTGAG